MYSPKTVVTTGRKFSSETLSIARELANRLALPLVKRGRRSLEELRQESDAAFILVVKQEGLVLETTGGEFFFHPNLAQLRLKNLRLGQGDHLVEAMALAPGMRVLDATLGLATDATVASFAVGAEGKVTGLESSPLIAAVVSHGLKHFKAVNYPLQEAMRGIEVIHTDYLAYLKQTPDKTFDAVYFDPMFRHPFMASSHLNPLRSLADHRPVSGEAVREACRVAKRRVVLKESSHSEEFQRLGFTKIVGGRYSKIHYGIIEVSR